MVRRRSMTTRLRGGRSKGETDQKCWRGDEIEIHTSLPCIPPPLHCFQPPTTCSANSSTEAKKLVGCLTENWAHNGVHPEAGKSARRFPFRLLRCPSLLRQSGAGVELGGKSASCSARCSGQDAPVGSCPGHIREKSNYSFEQHDLSNTI